ncbi:E3 ubiquitin-protein ligase ATL41-like protein [Carex littledalei]|uniref:RING-type E3 ubiquitin transferase n=1 Tax=Carex littledalei TaxID=544730 RepID=A0A833RIP9_9POAL|nr:E3 ubiquitin-protein ligase ATL41-like protein [Carex littledalei]
MSSIDTNSPSPPPLPPPPSTLPPYVTINPDNISDFPNSPYNPYYNNNSWNSPFNPYTNYTTSGSSKNSATTYARFFTVAVVCLCLVASVVLFLHLYLRYVRRRHMLQHRRQTSNLLRLTTFNLATSDSPRPGLDRTAISSIPSFQYQKVEADSSENSTVDCAVCLSLLEEGDVVRMLPDCRHVFHVACIDKWLASSASCPVCRSEVSPQPHVRSGSQSRSQSVVVEVSDAPAQDQSGTKEEAEAGTSVSTRFSTSLRRIVNSNRSLRRVQDDAVVEDLERGNNGANSNN